MVYLKSITVGDYTVCIEAYPSSMETVNHEIIFLQKYKHGSGSTEVERMTVARFYGMLPLTAGGSIKTTQLTLSYPECMEVHKYILESKLPFFSMHPKAIIERAKEI